MIYEVNTSESNQLNDLKAENKIKPVFNAMEEVENIASIENVDEVKGISDAKEADADTVAEDMAEKEAENEIQDDNGNDALFGIEPEIKNSNNNTKIGDIKNNAFEIEEAPINEESSEAGVINDQSDQNEENKSKKKVMNVLSKIHSMMSDEMYTLFLQIR